MKIDAHQHFWRYRSEDYPWMSADMAILRRDWLPDDLRPLLREHGFGSCIAVQARCSEAETDFLLELAGQHDWIAGVVGWAELGAAALPGRLERWAGAEKLVGFRHLVQDEADVAAFLSNPGFRRGVATLQQRSMIYEVLVYARQLAPVPAFCGACDRHWVVLDHLGKPAIRDGAYETWRRQLLPLASMDHVACKVSGLVTEAADATGRFDAGELPRYLDTALEIFGPEKLMFGSDWPVCLLAASYAEVVEIVRQWAAQLTASEREAILGGTASRVFALTPASSADDA